MDFNQIKELVAIFDESKLFKMEVSEESFSIKLEKSDGRVVQTAPPVVDPAPVHVHPAQPAPAAVESGNAPKGDEVLSPMVGTFYRATAPNAAPFVNVGDTVRKGQTLCVLEAMKIMNELEADFDCKIVDIVPDDGQPIEYGAPLFIVEKL